jgi:rhomboid protease GluP
VGGPRTPGSDDGGSVTIAQYLEEITPRAWVTPTLAALILVGFAAEITLGASPVNPTGEQLVAAGANYGPLVADGQWWRGPASLFVHAGVIHIGFNLWAFWSIGKYAERVFGNVAFLAIYFLSGFAGVLASLAVHPLTVSVGASGAIFGVFGAMLAFVSRRDNRQVFPQAFLLAQRRSLLAFVGYNVVFGLAVPQVDLSAHAGGMVVGLITGALLTRDLRHPRAHFGGRMLNALGILILLGVTAFMVQRRLEAVPEVRADRAASAALGHLKKKELPQAIELYTQAIEDNRDAGWLSNRGLAYLWGDQLALAEADFKEAHALAPEPRTLALLCETEARLARTKDELAGAERRCTEALAGEPKNAALLLLRATVRDASRQEALALADADAAVALEPDSEVGRRVRLNVRVGETVTKETADAAEEDCGVLLARSAPTAFDLRTCARVAKARGDVPAVRKRLDQALAVAPADAIALTLRAELAEQDGRVADSLADYKALVAAAPELDFAWNNLAWLEVLGADFAAARTDADRAVSENAESAPSRGTRCFALVGLGLLAEARPDCEKAIELDPSSSPDRGMLAFIDGRYDDARRAWDQASADPVLARELAPWKARLPAR